MSRRSKIKAAARGTAGMNRRTATRLASLSTLGAAALAMGAGEAYATIYYSGPITTGNEVGLTFNATSGIHTVMKATVVPGGIGPQHLAILAELFGYRGKGYLLAQLTAAHLQNESFLATGGLRAPRGFPFVAGLPRGGTTKAVHSVSGARTALVAEATTFSPGAKFITDVTKTDPYLLFDFKTSAHKTVFGWANVGLSLVAKSSSFALTLTETIKSYAYSDSGQPLPAGEVPEPSSGSLELAALAALVIGGPALRRWRADRQAQRAAAEEAVPA
jgi:hypothetical protein